ncbi:MAG: DUF934 domain-containing protein [Candidatus Methylumidiphilus sp.]
MSIIKDRAIVADDIRHLADDEAPTGRSTVSFTRWRADKAALAAAGVIGVRLHGADPVADIAADLPNLALIVIEFPALADGRGFSQARLLRDRYGYAGEIRATGDFLRDQVYFLARVGVNAFEPKAGADLENLLSAFKDFSVNYQGAADHNEPVYRKRG